MTKVNPILAWWVSPKLPFEDVFANHTKGKRGFEAFKINFSQWVIHPVKRRYVKFYLNFLRKFTKITVICVTGSAGKSTTVQMLASILRNLGKVCSTPPSIDPVYNIPNTIAKCHFGTRYLILETSVEYPDEMDYYLWLARPDVGIVLNIYPTHTKFFENEEGVFEEKKKLVEALPKDGLSILNREDRRLSRLGRRLKSKVVWFGNANSKPKSGNEFTLKIGESKIDVHLPILGNQFIQNAVASAVCAHELGANMSQIKHGLESFSPPEHRMRVVRHKSGALILDDTYNSNPQAAKEALQTFGAFSGDKKKVVVMGDMLELGRSEDKYHKELGQIIGKMGVDYLIGVGTASKILVKAAQAGLEKKRTFWVSDQGKVLQVLSPLLNKNTVVLIKGSRSIFLEKVVEKLSK